MDIMSFMQSLTHSNTPWVRIWIFIIIFAVVVAGQMMCPSQTKNQHKLHPFSVPSSSVTCRKINATFAFRFLSMLTSLPRKKGKKLSPWSKLGLTHTLEPEKNLKWIKRKLKIDLRRWRRFFIFAWSFMFVHKDFTRPHYGLIFSAIWESFSNISRWFVNLREKYFNLPRSRSLRLQ